jgi:hypothetical protein
MRIRDPGWRKFGSGKGMEKLDSGIRDKHPGFATLLKWHSPLPVSSQTAAVRSNEQVASTWEFQYIKGPD